MYEGWFYVENHKQQGPIDLADLQRLFKSHELPLDTLVWHINLTSWTAADSLNEFHSHVHSAPVTSPAPQPPPQPTPQPTSTAVTSTGHHPWRRCFARAIDTALLVPLFASITHIYPTGANDIKFNAMTIAFAIIAHALLQSTWGSTPGKAILGYNVRTHSGEKMTFEQALRREGNIAWHGLGFAIPFYSIYTLIRSYGHPNSTGSTTWDAAGNFRVTHRK